jgi:hypothetical protein
MQEANDLRKDVFETASIDGTRLSASPANKPHAIPSQMTMCSTSEPSPSAHDLADLTKALMPFFSEMVASAAPFERSLGISFLMVDFELAMDWAKACLLEEPSNMPVGMADRTASVIAWIVFTPAPPPPLVFPSCANNLLSWGSCPGHDAKASAAMHMARSLAGMRMVAGESGMLSLKSTGHALTIALHAARQYADAAAFPGVPFFMMCVTVSYSTEADERFSNTRVPRDIARE